MKIAHLAASLVICSVWVLQIPQAAADATERVLYSFADFGDGAYANFPVVNVEGTLYGTTQSGGNGCEGGCGIIYSVNPENGVYKLLYSLCTQANCTDGAQPTSGLINVEGTLYGETYAGGLTGCGNDLGCGTVFAFNPNTGSEKALYSFCGQKNCTDGQEPTGGLIYVHELLYGTTYYGGGKGCGGKGCGTVFSLDPSTGVENVIYSFCTRKNCTDGANPEASLIDIGGTLYGTTYEGGNENDSICGSGGYKTCGTVFSVDPVTGVEKVIYALCGQQDCADGATPVASLISVKGLLYGTTRFGGGCGGVGCGTVFSVDPTSGYEKAVYSFCGKTKRNKRCTDGTDPFSNLIDVNGTLYGTTYSGGIANYICRGGGCGVVYSLHVATGTEKVIYSFCQEKHCADGASPFAGLINVGGTLYGTTNDGGANESYGTVFEITVP